VVAGTAPVVVGAVAAAQRPPVFGALMPEAPVLRTVRPEADAFDQPADPASEPADNTIPMPVTRASGSISP